MPIIDNKKSGFTIVELLIVIVVIAVLAAIVTMSFRGIQDQARTANLKADLSGAVKQMELVKVDSGSYPTSLSTAGLKPSAGTNFQLISSGSSYCLSANSTANSSLSYKVSNTSSTPQDGTCSGQIIGGGGSFESCPSGFIVVPGNSNFGTSDFCVSKYEMKIVGQDDGRQTYVSTMVPESRASGTPWVNISQTNAIAEAQTVCSGCHLISEAEWMTIAANVLSVTSNWSEGSVGGGSIYRGHGDSSPSNPLSASSNDNDGYTGTGNSGNNQRRTLTLTNGEVIWDIAGNVRDMTSATVGSGQQPGLSGETAYGWKEWTDSLIWGGFPVTSRPSAISAQAATWSSVEGIGRLYSNYADTATRSMLRGGSWYSSSYPGILALNLGSTPASSAHPENGFRVAR